MFRRALTPRWLGALVLAAAFAVGCYHLGWWQYGRHLAKVERNARLDANYASPARPVTQVMSTQDLPVPDQWTSVTATGAYVEGSAVYVRNRPNLGSYGYEVLAAFRVDSGEILLVDRGWVKNSSAGASTLPTTPPPPAGEVTLTGWTLPSEPSLGRRLPAGQLASINTAQAAQALKVPLLGGFVRLDQERGPAGELPRSLEALDPPDRSLGPHQAYAWNWWLIMPLGFVLIWFRIRAEVRSSEPTQRKDLPAGGTTGPLPKKTRIWDEEDA